MTKGRPLISFVIPAHNEQAVLGQTLATLIESAKSLKNDFEVIVVADACTDQTAQIAEAAGAVVVPVDLRKISAVRNAGARVARGEILIFVDADTLVPPDVLVAVMKELEDGAVGGGAMVRLDHGVPWWGRVMTSIVIWAFYRRALAAGCFLFARKSAFDAVGGFDEQYFASEEVHLSRALKTKGRFVIVPQAVTTSARKFRMFSGWRFMRQAAQLFRGKSALTRRETLGMWYDGDREQRG